MGSSRERRLRPPPPGIALIAGSIGYGEAGYICGLQQDGTGGIDEGDTAGVEGFGGCGEGFDEEFFEGAGFGAEEGARLCESWE